MASAGKGVAMFHVTLKRYNDFRWPAAITLNDQYVGTCYFETEAQAIAFKEKLETND